MAGVNKHYATVAQVTIAGVNYTPAALVTALQAVAQMLIDVETAEASYKAKLAVASVHPGLIPVLVTDTTAFVRANVGATPDVLHDFGLAPRKPNTPLTAAQKAAAAEKRNATRAARHTMGSKQKKSVTGAVPAAATATPAPAVPAPSAAASTSSAAVPAVTPGK